MSAMSHPLHTILYQDIFNGHELAKPMSLSFASNKRIIVLSDCHLDSRFDEHVFLKFKKIIEKADVLVINGDFWADSAGSFEKFITSKWQKLFPLLKAKKTYYIFGNHDMPILSDERIYQFCEWAGFRLKIKAGDISLHIEHGHLLSGNLVRNLFIAFQRHPKLLKYVTFPYGLYENSAKFVTSRTRFNLMKKLNTEFKTSRLWVSTEDEYFFMGHTHVPEFDVNARYVNTGLTHNGHFNYVEVYQNKINIRSL
jgi:predicted phosphodiesterase